MMKRLLQVFMISLVVSFCGCITKSVNVQSTKSWEGHYYNVEDFEKSTKNIVLEENESIWVLSNRTLNRLLQNTEK